MICSWPCECKLLLLPNGGGNGLTTITCKNLTFDNIKDRMIKFLIFCLLLVKMTLCIKMVQIGDCSLIKEVEGRYSIVNGNNISQLAVASKGSNTSGYKSYLEGFIERAGCKSAPETNLEEKIKEFESKTNDE